MEDDVKNMFPAPSPVDSAGSRYFLACGHESPGLEIDLRGEAKEAWCDTCGVMAHVVAWYSPVFIFHVNSLE